MDAPEAELGINARRRLERAKRGAARKAAKRAQKDADAASAAGPPAADGDDRASTGGRAKNGPRRRPLCAVEDAELTSDERGLLDSGEGSGEGAGEGAGRYAILLYYQYVTALPAGSLAPAAASDDGATAAASSYDVERMLAWQRETCARLRVEVLSADVMEWERDVIRCCASRWAIAAAV